MAMFMELKEHVTHCGLLICFGGLWHIGLSCTGFGSSDILCWINQCCFCLFMGFLDNKESTEYHQPY